MLVAREVTIISWLLRHLCLILSLLSHSLHLSLSLSHQAFVIFLWSSAIDASD